MSRSMVGFVLLTLVSTGPFATLAGAEEETSSLFASSDVMPVWHSIVFEFTTRTRVEGELIVTIPGQSTGFSNRHDAKFSTIVAFERQRSDGGYWGFASLGLSHYDSRGSLLVTLDAGDAHVDLIPQPYMHVYPAVFGWGLEADPGRYRITTWGAAEENATYAFTMNGPSNVAMLGITHGTDAGLARLERTAAANASASVQNRAITGGALASFDHKFTNRAYIMSTNDNQPTTSSGCGCLRHGPPGSNWEDANLPPWGPRSIFGGPPGAYGVDAIAFYGLGPQFIPGFVSTNPLSYVNPVAYRPTLYYSFADVVPPAGV